jgi:hypothetical protein
MLEQRLIGRIDPKLSERYIDGYRVIALDLELVRWTDRPYIHNYIFEASCSLEKYDADANTIELSLVNLKDVVERLHYINEAEAKELVNAQIWLRRNCGIGSVIYTWKYT